MGKKNKIDSDYEISNLEILKNSSAEMNYIKKQASTPDGTYESGDDAIDSKGLSKSKSSKENRKFSKAISIYINDETVWKKLEQESIDKGLTVNNLIEKMIKKKDKENC